VEILAQLARRAFLEACPHPADIDQLVALVGGQQQPTDPTKRRRGWLVANDHEAVALDAFDLDPVAATIGVIWRIDPLGDDALEAMFARGFEERGAIGFDRFGKPDGAERVDRNDALQQMPT